MYGEDSFCLPQRGLINHCGHLSKNKKAASATFALVIAIASKEHTNSNNLVFFSQSSPIGTLFPKCLLFIQRLNISFNS